MKKKIDIIGRGNVGSHLQRAFAPEADVRLVESRTLSGLRPDSDFYIICVSDNAIAEVAWSLASRLPGDAVLAHTSGATEMNALCGSGHPHLGVIYPLQTFSKEKELDYSRIPFFIEGNGAEEAAALSELASLVSRQVVPADSAKRKELHVGSVFACNFVNHLFALSAEYLESCGIDFRLLLPLIEETVGKIKEMRPEDAQTGPARRGDDKTIAAHMRLLADDPQLSALYSTLTDSIRHHYTARKE